MFYPFNSKNVINTEARVKNLVSVLDNNWYKRNKIEFIHQAGSKHYIEVDHTPQDYEIYLNDLNKEGLQDYNDYYQQIDIETFCYDKSRDINRGDVIVTKIMDATEEIIKNRNAAIDFEKLNASILQVKNWIREESQRLIRYVNIAEYSSVMNFFVEKCTMKIDMQFYERLVDFETDPSFYERLVDFETNPSSGNLLPLKDSLITDSEISNVEPSKTVVIRPTINERELSKIHEFLKVYFSEVDQIELLYILQTGDIVNKKLHFRSSANRLADFFKQLYAGKFILGCEKKDLQIWIKDNFTYQKGNNIAEFKSRYLEDVISTGKDMCKNPIIDVKQNKITGEYSITKS